MRVNISRYYLTNKHFYASVFISNITNVSDSVVPRPSDPFFLSVECEVFLAKLWDSICPHTPRPHRTAQQDHEGLSRLGLGRCVSGPLASRRPRGGEGCPAAGPGLARPRGGSGSGGSHSARARTCWSFRPPRPASRRSTPGQSAPQSPPRRPHPLPSLQRRRAVDSRAGPRQEGGGTRRPRGHEPVMARKWRR